MQTAQLTTMVERLIEQNWIVKGFKGFEPNTVEGNMPPRYQREATEKRTAKKPADTKAPNHEFHQLAAVFKLSKVVLKHGRVDQSS